MSRYFYKSEREARREGEREYERYDGYTPQRNPYVEHGNYEEERLHQAYNDGYNYQRRREEERREEREAGERREARRQRDISEQRRHEYEREQARQEQEQQEEEQLEPIPEGEEK